MKRNFKGIVIVLALVMMCSSFLTGCTKPVNADVSVISQDESQTVALLGELQEDVSDEVQNQLAQLVQETTTYATQREADGDYNMSEEEYALWEKITSLLDKETVRQFGEDSYEEENNEADVDYGKDILKNLKETLESEDWDNLEMFRKDYLSGLENTELTMNLDPEGEIRKIIDKYEQLDADAVMLNLLNEKNQHDLGIFKITPNQDVVYQNGEENGLAVLDTKEQESLKKIWEKTTDVLPKELFADFKYFKVGGDGNLGSQAYVLPIDGEGKLWCMSVDPADVMEDGLFPYTVVHEMGHYLTLNETQVDYFGDQVEFYPVGRYTDSQCVAKKDSYIQAFYEMFWKDIVNDWATNRENSYFYIRHASQFVTEYAATECAEDMAESFAAYVLLEKAPTAEMQQKLDFFDSYPELQTIKKEILENIQKNKVIVNSEMEPSDEE